MSNEQQTQPGKMPGTSNHNIWRRNPGAPKIRPKDTKVTIARLWHYLSVYRIRLIAVISCIIASTILTLAASYMIRPIVNSLLDSHTTRWNLVQSIIIMAILYICSVSAQYLQKRIMLETAQKSIEQMRNDLYSKFQKLPIRYFDAHSHGDLMSRFTNDIDAIGDLMTNTVVQIISTLITLVGTFSLMLYTNFILTLITIAMIPVIMLTLKIITSHSRKYYKAQQKAMGALNNNMEDLMQVIRK